MIDPSYGNCAECGALLAGPKCLSCGTPHPLVVPFIQALTDLVAALDKCKPHIDSLCVFADTHGVPYAGPTYGVELEKARAAIEAK